MQVHLDRDGDHHWILFNLNWRRVSAPSDDCDPAPPASLGAMIAAAETLGDALDFVRVDLYEIAGRALFGEMTFYPGSGLDPFRPDAIDSRMGAIWNRVRGAAPVVGGPSPVHTPATV